MRQVLGQADHGRSHEWIAREVDDTANKFERLQLGSRSTTV